MTARKFIIRPQQPDDIAAIIALHKTAFGPGRFARTAFRLREHAPSLTALNLKAVEDSRLIGSVWFSAIMIGGKHPAVLLGPLAVDPCCSGRGVGLALLRAGLTGVKEAGHGLVILVGDEPFYGKAGFTRIPHGQIILPGPVDPDRLLAAELDDGALGLVSGMARPG